ncbi:iron ABC transporter substrate-binding protein [Microbacterium esteraromaticum]|uniref:iron ABC transporter substrate-binding protein n=1 Tax=Microbacterium esteraromaticum TaxID=57043 RepID=UPI002368F26B|nr:iron ABC transporter substrate-binding protein [Microbacterium esteraromaticum]WDH80030.1 iron ABC transporter substrate-binding protein [Microbacterium esteraromaticum]
MPVIRTRRIAPVVGIAVAALLVGCTPGGGDDALIIYNAQHEQLTEEWTAAFTAETGIEVKLRHGGDSELANQIVQEGDASPADVFLTENSPAMALVEDAGLFAPIDEATLQRVPEQFRPSTGSWTGIAARDTVLVYNPELISEDELPASILELQDEKWQGQWGAAPGGADFQAIVSAILASEGEDATADWLVGMQRNAEIYRNNIVTMKAVNAGEVPMGIIYHYYWYRDQASTKENSGNTALHLFEPGDPGAFVSISGGGVLASSDRSDEAQQFLTWLVGEQGQTILGEGYSYEYPVATGIPARAPLPALESLGAPEIDPSTLNGPTVIDLMTEAGLL